MDGRLWDKFQKTLKDEWQGSFTTWVEFSMECYMRDSCDGCPYEEDEEKEKGAAKIGIGKTRDK